VDVKLTILVPEELRRKAKAAAALRGVTVAEVVREALERFVREQEEEAKKDRSSGG
jgi:hypothetical protein